MTPNHNNILKFIIIKPPFAITQVLAPICYNASAGAVTTNTHKKRCQTNTAENTILENTILFTFWDLQIIHRKVQQQISPNISLNLKL
jgi:hypothetical protein